MSKHFILYSCCIPVKGALNAVIMDLQRTEFLPIPNLLADILNNNLYENSVEAIKECYNNELDQGIDKYFDFLNKEEYGFYTETPNLFPPINFDFNSPNQIISSVVSYADSSKYDLIDSLNQLNDLGCQILQIRFFDSTNLSFLESISNLFVNSGFRIIEFVLKEEGYKNEIFEKVIINNPRVKVIVHSSEINGVVDFNEDFKHSFIKTSRTINEDTKEDYFLDSFTCNTTFYNEALFYNSGLNRKVCIDHNGEIKNFVNHNKSFGNISKKRLKDIVVKDDFQRLWYVKNDLIEKCKDCQYRYMCMSNSDVEMKAGKYYKKDSCDFDPCKDPKFE